MTVYASLNRLVCRCHPDLLSALQIREGTKTLHQMTSNRDWNRVKMSKMTELSLNHFIKTALGNECAKSECMATLSITTECTLIRIRT